MMEKNLVQPGWAQMQTEMGKIAYCAGYYYRGSYPSWNFPIKSEDRGINLVQQFSMGIGSEGVVPTDQYAELDGDPIIQDYSPLSVGESTLTNTTGQEMDMLTPSFSYQHTYTTSTTTTKEFNVGIKNTTTVKVPVVKNSTEVSTEFSFSNTGTTETSTQTTYSIPSQTIPTLPGHTYKVEYMLATGEVSGKVDFYGDATGTLPILDAEEYHTLFFENAGDALNIAKQDPYYANQFEQAWTQKGATTISYKGGKATYIAEYGYDFYLKVTDTTTSKVRHFEVDNLDVNHTQL
ncbi:ETX/MTX2 family pore-forming toxin [Salipaludibacillus sp. LMS25]|jgi:hypothetical protein|uniref:ETX/MTX2 family pore-forming toxin n=1 Tax=Salipaludibacillus sp. LMS25 TaxID=2924031 RepID=UPI0020D10F38|nr:ETX/MTX2 family pore-forming toxin [Salipaludibacillus sp. LMS25]UTR13304.1 ETX/MTX2 family pore-forming toxin [Salipaludibacillus sp. LMS25]